MSDYNYGGWGHYGFAAHAGASNDLDGSYDDFAVGQVAGIARSQGVPDDAHLYDILFELSDMATGAGAPSAVSFYLARDSAGTQPLTQVHTATIVKALGGASAVGGAHALIQADFHSTSGVGPTAYNTLYVIARLNTGTATPNIYLSWRS